MILSEGFPLALGKSDRTPIRWRIGANRIDGESSRWRFKSTPKSACGDPTFSRKTFDARDGIYERLQAEFGRILRQPRFNQRHYPTTSPINSTLSATKAVLAAVINLTNAHSSLSRPPRLALRGRRRLSVRQWRRRTAPLSLLHLSQPVSSPALMGQMR